MHARNRNLGNGYRSHSMVMGGASTASRILPDSSMRGQGAYRSEYRNSNHGGYGRGQSRQFQQPPPQKHGDVFMEAGRLATEYLVSKGLIPPNVLTGKWKNDSFRNHVRVNTMQLSSEGRTSALSRLSGPVTDAGLGRRRYQDDHDSLNSNDMRDRRSGSFKSYSADRRREFGRSGSMSDRSRASAGVDDDKDVVPSCQDEQRNSNGGDIVSVNHSRELTPEKDSCGIVESMVQKPNLIDEKGPKESSSSSEKDLSILGDMELLEKVDVKNPDPEAGEIIDENDNKVEEHQHTKDDIIVKKVEKMDTVSSEKNCDLIKFCSFVKVPTRTRSSIACRGLKRDVDSIQNQPTREYGYSVEDMGVDNLSCNDSAILQPDNLEISSTEEDDSVVIHNNSLNNSTSLISEVDTFSLKEVVMNEKIPECVIINSNERGEKRAMNDEITTKDKNKKLRESAASENLPECMRFSSFLERQPCSKDLDGAVPLPSEKRLLDITLFPKGDIESCIDYAEEKHLFPGSFKTCDLNLMEASEVNEKHENNSVLVFPSTENVKQPTSVEIVLAMSNDSLVSNSFRKCSISGKGIEVIDLDNEPEQEDMDFNNSDGRSDNVNVFTCLDGYSNNTHNGTDISDVQDGYGLMISELLGNEMASCSSVSNSLHSDMELHSGEGILADDDSVYMSLGEIPMSFLRDWEQSNHDYGKPF